MRKEISYKVVYLTFGILVVSFAIVSFAIAQWSEPISSPPGDNVATPLNVSNVGQSKVGGLILNTGGAVYGLIVDQGNVGIGTPTPSEKLDIVGNVVASGTVCDSNGCIGDAPAQVGFGDWVLIASSVPVGRTGGPVATDGFIVAYSTINSHITGETRPPAGSYTVRLKQNVANEGSGAGSITLPVKRGDYWKVGGYNMIDKIYWIPLGN